MAQPGWLQDARFRTPALRQQHINERLALTQAVLRTGPAAQWLDRLTHAGVPCAPVLTRTDTLSDPQIQANGIVVETLHPVAGRLRQGRPAARFSATPQTIRTAAPGYGEHTTSAFIEAGLSQTDVEALSRQGVFGPEGAAAA